MDYSRREVEKEIAELKDRRRYRRGQIMAIVLRAILFIGILFVLLFGIPAVISLRDSLQSGSDYAAVSGNTAVSQVYDRNGNLICDVPQDIEKAEIAYESIPANLINAVITAEDPEFWTSDGLDLSETAAQLVDLFNGKSDASHFTIAEQLIVSGAVPESGTSFQSKLGSLLRVKRLAAGLCDDIGKEAVLERYLNGLYFGNGVTGVQTAARRYFGKSASELSLGECVLLAAAAEDPYQYNPISDQDALRGEISTILASMQESGYITAEEAAEAEAEDPVSDVLTVPSEGDSYAASSYSDFVLAALEQAEQDYAEAYAVTPTKAHQMVTSGGCRIVLTIDAEFQTIVEREIHRAAAYTDDDGNLIRALSLTYRLTVQHDDGTRDSYNESDVVKYFRTVRDQPSFQNYFTSSTDLRAAVQVFRESVTDSDDVIADEVITAVPEPQASCVLIDPATGQVLALSGGRKSLNGQSTVNRAADQYCQPGSTFQVLADYLPAIDVGGKTLASVYYDSPYTDSGTQIVNWWGSSYLGYSTIRQAIKYSMNVIAVKCMSSTVTPSQSFDYLTELGFSSLTSSDRTSLLALGKLSQGVTNLELTSAYASFANDGVHIEPRFYRRITDSDGTVLLKASAESTRVMKSSTAALLTSAMEDVISGDNEYEKYGLEPTGTACRITGWETAGKSGTSLSSTDLWFVGYTSRYACGVWAGYDNGQTVSVSSEFHKRIWQRIMTAVHDGLEPQSFEFSDSLESAVVCSKSGQLAVEDVCDSETSGGTVYEEVFAPGTAPTDYCTRHYAMKICAESGMLATVWCPPEQVYSKVFMRISESDLSSDAETADLDYLAPSSLTACTLHTEEPAAEETETEEESEAETGAAAETETVENGTEAGTAGESADEPGSSAGSETRASGGQAGSPELYPTEEVLPTMPSGGSGSAMDGFPFTVYPVTQ